MNNHILILAAGNGMRMGSDKPKILVELNGRSILRRLLDNIEDVCGKPTIIIGNKGEEVIKATNNQFEYIWQKEQKGTGHAVRCAKEKLEKRNYQNILILPGDHPCVKAETLNGLIKANNQEKAALTLATLKLENYDGINQGFYHCGRIIRNKNNEIESIIEFKDTNDEQKKITEVNISYYCFSAKWLWENIDKLENNNQTKEYYLTDMIKIAKAQGQKIGLVIIKDVMQGFGINTADQLKELEKIV